MVLVPSPLEFQCIVRSITDFLYEVSIISIIVLKIVNQRSSCTEPGRRHHILEYEIQSSHETIKMLSGGYRELSIKQPLSKYYNDKK